jgi:hypothetical protein
MIGAGMLWMSLVSDSTSYASGVLGPILLFGAGAGLAMTALSGVILSDVSGKSAGSAASVLEVMQWIGFTLGISILSTVFGSASREAAAAVPGDARHALIEGLGSAFTASLAFVVISIVITLIVIKPAAPQPEAAAAPVDETEVSA